MEFACGRYLIRLVDEPAYSFGSADNIRAYEKEISFNEQGFFPNAIHGLTCLEDGRVCGSLAIGGSGAGTSVHERSCVVVDDHCFVAVGNRVARLSPPRLEVLWQLEGDTATCFGLYLTRDSRHIVVHGECEIRMFTTSGQQVWKFHGRDIFTGPFAMTDSGIEAVDFEGLSYFIDLETGAGRIAQAG
jgi:hypothetical protein